MANDANIFKAGDTAAGYVTPSEWSNAIEQVARESNLFRNLTDSIIVEDRVGVPGNTFYVQKNSALSAADVTDGNSATISTVVFTQISVSATIKAVATQITLKNMRDNLSSVRNDVVLNMGTAIAEKEETDIITECYTTTSTSLYANSTTTSSITGTDTFDVDLLIEGRRAMRTDKRQARYLVIHPNQEADLINDNKFLDASQFGGTEANRQGFIGRYLGVDVFASTNIDSDTHNGNTVYKALLLGPRALVLLDKAKPVLEFDRNLVQDLSMTMVAYADYGLEVLNTESIRILNSA
jgi:N4-gp56 family major capsid protein